MAAMYAVYHGPMGLQNIAARVHNSAILLARGKLFYRIVRLKIMFLEMSNNLMGLWFQKFSRSKRRSCFGSRGVLRYAKDQSHNWPVGYQASCWAKGNQPEILLGWVCWSGSRRNSQQRGFGWFTLDISMQKYRRTYFDWPMLLFVKISFPNPFQNCKLVMSAIRYIPSNLWQSKPGAHSSKFQSAWHTMVDFTMDSLLIFVELVDFTNSDDSTGW